MEAQHPGDNSAWEREQLLCASHSKYHIDGYLTDFECAADIGIRDVQVFKKTIQRL